MPQGSSSTIDVGDILSNPAFILGIQDAEAGVMLYENYDRLSSHQQLLYERGRQFYLVTSIATPWEYDLDGLYANLLKCKILL